MMFDFLFYTSLFIFSIGTVYKITLWTKKSIGYQEDVSPSDRLSAMIKGTLSTIFSLDSLTLIQSFFGDVFFQKQILKTSLLRWTMHGLIFAGFMALLFMHALDDIFTNTLFAYYYSTVNPFFFLRDLFGLMVLSGLGIAAYRRYIHPPARFKNARSDLLAIGILFSIIISGVFLEGMKMASTSEFTAMVEEYAGLAYEDEDTLSLETYWVKEFALTSARITAPFEKDVLATGMELHEDSCMDCHSPNKSAFMGYAVAKVISPVAIFLDRINGVSFFYYVHIIACFLGLALVPFTKLFHMVATPISLMTTAAGKKNPHGMQTVLTRQLMELDACTHCSTCNANCSAGMMYESIQNDYILPSEKLQVLKTAAAAAPLSTRTRKVLFQGLYLCTNCDRCTVVCPSGINLKSLWLSTRELLVQQDPELPLVLSTFSFVRGLMAPDIEYPGYKSPVSAAFKKTTSVVEKIDPITVSTAGKNTNLPSTDTFSHCFGCQNCTTICPVVTTYETPEDTLILLPHQIMYCLGLGLTDMAEGSAMIWNCLSCYQCQEHCPQNVTVCDILFQLKNKTFKHIQDKDL